MGAISRGPGEDRRAKHARTTMHALTMSDDVFEAFFSQAQIGLALADLSTNYVRVNGAYAELLGRAPEDLVGVPFAQVLHPDDRTAEGLRVVRLLEGEEQALQAEERYVAPDGRTLWVLHSVTVVPGEDGHPGWFAVSAQDITERRRVEEEMRALTSTLAERAVHDPLTGLANRTLLEERLKTNLARDARTGATTAVLFLDLDGFKAINDAHGHAVGDTVLRAVGERLAAVVRPSDTVARIGGDEFVVVVEGATEPVVSALIGRLKTVVCAPVEVGDLGLAVGVSVGVAVATAGTRQPHDLLAEADQAMYAEKRAARG